MNTDFAFEDFNIEPNIDTELWMPPSGFQSGLREEETEEGISYLESFGDFGNQFDPIPMSEWDNYADAWKTLRPCVKEIFNQAQEPSCASNAQAQAMQTRGFIQFGDDPKSGMVRLSAASLYHRVKLRGGGSFISDNLKQTLNPGILPLDCPENQGRFEHLHPARGENKRLPSGWEKTAGLFQVETYLRITEIEEWFTALVMGFPINYGRDGHAIASIYPIKSRGNWVFAYANSWRESWGDKGFGYDSLGKIKRCTGYAVVSVTVRPGVEPLALNENRGILNTSA